MTITDTIKELRELLDTATVGPWAPRLNKQSSSIAGEFTYVTIETECYHPQQQGHVNIIDIVIGPDADGKAYHIPHISYDDAALIIEMRNALPMLLDAAQRAQRYERALTGIATGHAENVSYRDTVYILKSIAAEAIAPEPSEVLGIKVVADKACPPDKAFVKDAASGEFKCVITGLAPEPEKENDK
jgi:hypothetical protein